MQLTLVIGDPHVEQEENFHRFHLLANLIEDILPDNICQMGDFLSLDSISSYDKFKLLLREGRRLKTEIENGYVAREIIDGRIESINNKARRGHRPRYNPTKKWFIGNHEDRLKTYMQTHPELLGLLGDDPSIVGAESAGWDVIPYPRTCVIDSVAFMHTPFNPRTGKPLGGEYISGRAASFETQTVVFAHTHRRLMHSLPTSGQRRDGINVGWFGGSTPHYIDEQSKEKQDWWAGLVLLHHVAPSHVDPEFISMERLERLYG